MTPFFSIVIPIYNTELYLDECLQSIENQTYGDFEVIMVDDGSIDRSADICRKYQNKDSRFRYYYKENSGSTSTRKYAANRANGESIVCEIAMIC